MRAGISDGDELKVTVDATFKGAGDGYAIERLPPDGKQAVQDVLFDAARRIADVLKQHRGRT